MTSLPCNGIGLRVVPSGWVDIDQVLWVGIKTLDLYFTLIS